jgi:TetR/AcrR family transcriptional regulator, mexCD-oprJ operon repressor
MMPRVTRGTAVRDRVAAAILDVAVDLFAQGGEPPSMGAVAEAAGVARATLYRYFPSRELLLKAVSATVLEATATGLAGAELDQVPVSEAVARVARVIAAAGSKYSALRSTLMIEADYSGVVEKQIEKILEALVDRGVNDGTLRRDFTVKEMMLVFGQLLGSLPGLVAEHGASAEHAAALVTSVFLHGTARREDATEI